MRKILYVYLVYQVDNYMFLKNVAWQFRAWTAGHNVVLSRVLFNIIDMKDETLYLELSLYNLTEDWSIEFEIAFSTRCTDLWKNKAEF